MIASLLALMVILATAIPAFALAPPDSITIYSAKVVRNVAQAGDVAIFFHGNLHYAVYPTTPSGSLSFMFRLYSPDGLTLLTTAVPASYLHNGYGHFVSCFYFPAASAPTWGEAYRINVAGSPAYFDPLPDVYNYTITSSDYSAVTDQADNQELLKSWILAACVQMEIADPTKVMHGNTDAGTVLTAIGEAYFSQAVPGLLAMCPQLYFTQYYVPEATALTYGTAQQDLYTARMTGTDLMNGFNRIGLKFGVTGSTIAAFLVIVLSIGLIILTTWKNWGVEPGVIAAGILMSAGALLLGDALWTIRIIMAFLAGICIMYMLFGRKGG